MTSVIEVTDAEENISAISAVFHQHPQHHQFYINYGPKMNGFTGIWELCAVMGRIFTNATKGVEWDGEWIDAIDTFVDRIYDKASAGCLVMDDAGVMEQLAKEAVRTAFQKESNDKP